MSPRARSPFLLSAAFVWWATSLPAAAESGYELWLRYPTVADQGARKAYAVALQAIVVQGRSPGARVAAVELDRGLRGLLGAAPAQWNEVKGPGSVVAGTPSSSPLVAGLGWEKALSSAGSDGYVIRSSRIGGHPVTVVASRGDAGVLYGVFHLLRLVQTGRPLTGLDLTERPRIERRLLNHWDNLDGSIERGYAGSSLWRWPELPDKVDVRLIDYARANASIGINGAVLNNVNAKADSLTAPYLAKTAAIADAFRPYGIRVYLSANFAAPRLIGGLSTADPLDPAVGKWWKAKAAEVYERIPDFGGFLVKANSEGQPGPQDYGRTHADGANMLADAVAPHGGIVMWRAFVYNAEVDPDRIKRAYLEFVPLDGKFRENVFVQVKNGPLDFQPREPFHPLFGAMPKTPLAAELQVTQEYLGHATHLVYLAPMWKEFLDSDTFARGAGSTVAKVVDGSLHGYRGTAVAGVANTGDETNWCGHDMAQANWYAYGRLAWNPRASAEVIADDWIRMTWSQDPSVVSAITRVLLESHRIHVRYSMPLGLHHLIGGDHYAPMPENDDSRRRDWTAIEYHRAGTDGIGYDRTKKGSDAVSQYRAPLRERWGNPASCPDELLLWFHHLPWDHPMRSGGTLWDALVREYTEGAREAGSLEEAWKALSGRVDPERHAAVAARLRRQVEHAAEWRDHCLSYFAKFSGRPLPP